MLFSGGARVNLHTLAASALKMTETDFNLGALRFAAENPESTAVIANHGLIEAKDGGAVFLLAPRVENSGTVNAPKGEVYIAGGNQAEYEKVVGTTGEETNTFTVSQTGAIHNMKNGRIVADGGDIRMFANVVNTDGLIRSVNAFNNQGRIELRAAETLQTGPQSIISSPVSESTEAFHQSFNFGPGAITLQAGQLVNLNGRVSAPGGTVNIRATGSGGRADIDTPRIYVASDSVIDVSGSWANKRADDQTVEFQLNSVELRDDFGQKESDLKGESITFNQTFGSAIGNVESHLSKEETTAAERTTAGGQIRLFAPQGDIIIRQDALLDISGGGFTYQSGTVETTKLVNHNRIYDISDAPQYISYDRVMGTHQTVNERFGLVEIFKGLYSGGSSALIEYWSC
jgi:hypothetical protein